MISTVESWRALQCNAHGLLPAWWAWLGSVGEMVDEPGQCSCGAVGVVQGAPGEDGGRVVASGLRLGDGGVFDDLTHVLGYHLA